MLLQVLDSLCQRQQVKNKNIVGSLVLIQQVVVASGTSESDTEQETSEATSNGTNSLWSDHRSSGI